MSKKKSDVTEELADAPSLLPLKLVVLVCGAVLMSLEMAGVRIINVHFGSTTYVWGAIIGIFLGALSLGYYIGGNLADRWPRHSVLGAIIFIAAVFVLIVPWIARPLCVSLGRADLDPRWQALLSAMALYFIPSVALGMVSPFAVRLAASGLSDLGRVAGRLYALSTVGSIVGTFLTSFVLVEFIGTRNIIFSLGGTLVLCAIVMLVQGGRIKLASTAAVVSLALLIGGIIGTAPPKTIVFGSYGAYECLDQFDSAYHNILVCEGRSWYSAAHMDRRARMLMFNRQAQSGIELEGPGTETGVVSACGYTDLLHLGVIIANTPPKRALVIGCGGGVGPTTFQQDYPGIELIDIVDIDPAVFRMAEEHFRLRSGHDNPIIQTHVRDGRLFVRDAAPKSYDYIILDAYSAGGQIPFHLVTQEFFAEVSRLLTPDGVVVINLISATEDDPATSREEGQLYRAVMNTLATAFPQVYVFPRKEREGGSANIMLVASPLSKRLDRRDIETRFARLEGPVLKRPDLHQYVMRLRPRENTFPNAPTLTDDFAPTDSMMER